MDDGRESTTWALVEAWGAALGLEGEIPKMENSSGHSTELDEQDLLAAFEEAVASRLRFILEHHIARLPQLLYRIDVSERAVDRVFAEAESSDEVPRRLAKLIVARLVRIAKTRRASGE